MMQWTPVLAALAAITLVGPLAAGGCDDGRTKSVGGVHDGMADDPLNIVFILVDDLGYNDLTFHGDTRRLRPKDPGSARVDNVPTPNIDGLAAEGARFTRAYATAGTCSPSRAGLISGRYQQRFGFEFNVGEGSDRGLPTSVTTIADRLKEAGYVTGMVGKWHLGEAERFHPLRRGFDEFYGFLGGKISYMTGRSRGERLLSGTEPTAETEYLTDGFAREAVAFIRRHRNERFFLYVPFNAVHMPLEATAEYVARFPDVRGAHRIYFGMISALDDGVGRIVQALENVGLSERTLLVFTNDHGGSTSNADNAPLRFGKASLFEGGVRVPLIMRWPGVTTPGQVYEGVTSLLDLCPTFLRAAHSEAPDELDGIDLRPRLLGEAGSAREHLFWRNGPNRAVLYQGRWKLIQTLAARSARTGIDHTWLFDLEDDVGERNNLATSEPELVEELVSALDAWDAELAQPLWPSRPGSGDEVIDGVVYEKHL